MSSSLLIPTIRAGTTFIRGDSAVSSDPSAFAGGSSISPAGIWQSTTGESRYQVSLCGDGTELCAKLTWLRADARTKENLLYLNTYVVKGAQAMQANRWRGTVNYNGDTVSGSVTLVDADTLKLTGCKGFFCKALEFTRV